MRNIDKSMYKDIWYRGLSADRKLAWFGMISFLADDQGRFLVDPIEMRYVLFGGDINVSDDTILNIVNEFSMAGKVIYYCVNSNKICQLFNWWKYQIQSTYMAPSLLPSPDSWFDRYYINGKGKTKIKSSNWDTGTYGFYIPDSAITP
ncbi:MAG: hypothetical protein WCK35_25250 [Chloroflexota bacterium]